LTHHTIALSVLLSRQALRQADGTPLPPHNPDPSVPWTQLAHGGLKTNKTHMYIHYSAHYRDSFSFSRNRQSGSQALIASQNMPPLFFFLQVAS